AVVREVRRAELTGWRTIFSAPFLRHDSRGPERGQLFMGSGVTARWFGEAVVRHGGPNPATLADARALDANPALAAALPSSRLCVMAGGESAKASADLAQLLHWLTSIGAERNEPLVVAGGGTLGDVGGLAAALHHRGMPLVHVPTTWLAQADSVIGGKVAI